MCLTMTLFIYVFVFSFFILSCFSISSIVYMNRRVKLESKSKTFLI